MTDFEKDTVKLTAEELEQAAGGAGVGKRRFRVTQECAVRVGPGKDYGVIHTPCKGDMLEQTHGGSVDDRGVKWYRVMSHRGYIGYVSSRCVELV